MKGVADLLRLGDDLSLPPSAEELRLEVRGFLEEERVRGTYTPRCDAWHTGFSPELSRKLGARGWIGISWPTRYGGGGRTALDRYVITEELLAAGAPVAAHWVSDRQTGPGLLRYGTEEQRHRFMPGMAAGEIYFALGMSEPDSGSDLASLRTRAEPCDGGWRLSGTKVWSSHAHTCQFITVLCRTAGTSEDKHAGLSQLIVDLSSPGVSVRPIRILTGAHHFNEVVFDDVSVPAEGLLGEPGQGWEQITAELALERSGPERFMSTFPLLVELVEAVARRGGHGGVEAIGELVAELLALRRLSLAVAVAIESGEAPGLQAALVKDLGTRFERRVGEVSRLVIEPGARSDHDGAFGERLAEAVLLAPGAHLRGGTNEILRGIVAKGLGM